MREVPVSDPVQRPDGHLLVRDPGPGDVAGVATPPVAAESDRREEAVTETPDWGSAGNAGISGPDEDSR